MVMDGHEKRQRTFVTIRTRKSFSFMPYDSTVLSLESILPEEVFQMKLRKEKARADQKR